MYNNVCHIPICPNYLIINIYLSDVYVFHDIGLVCMTSNWFILSSATTTLHTSLFIVLLYFSWWRQYRSSIFSRLFDHHYFSVEPRIDYLWSLVVKYTIFHISNYIYVIFLKCRFIWTSDYGKVSCECLKIESIWFLCEKGAIIEPITRGTLGIRENCWI